MLGRRFLHCFALFSALLAGATAAAEEPATASRRAQLLFKDGLSLASEEKWQDAEAKFEQAFALNPSASTAANLGQVQARLKKFREAADHLQYAIVNWPEDSQIDKRERAAQRLAEVKREIVTLTVRVSTAGAMVFVGGRPVGAAPLDRELYTEAGNIEVRAEREGFTAARSALAVVKGKAYEVALSLERVKEGAAAEAEARALGPADEADLHFRRGADAYQRGEHTSALEHFLLSNRLVPNRNVIFNIARTYEKLEQWADAHRYYVEALRGETAAQTITAITSAIQRISPNVAVIEVETEPPGATIYFERKDLGARGRTPVPLAVAEGKYRVIVELAGYGPAVVEGVEAKLGGSTRVTVSLTRIVGRVLAGVEGAQSAEVRVDDELGARACEAPCALELPPGSHVLHFVREGFESTPRQIVVVANQTVRTTATMRPLAGSLSVSADERDAVIEVDGAAMGFTPSVMPNIPVGRRLVRIRLRGYKPFEQEVDIQANRQSRLLDVPLIPLREVAAASRVTERIDDAPSSVTIIDGQELQAFGYPTLWEALRGVRGVSLSNDRTYASASIRGLGEPNDYGNRMLVLSDGAVLNDNVLASSYIGTDGRADLHDVDRIEVVRGPGSLLYGTGAMSGVINLVPRAKDELSSVSGGVGVYEDVIMHARLGFHYNLSPKVGMWASLSGTRSDGTSVEVEPRTPANSSPLLAQQVDFQRGWGTVGRLWAGDLTAQWYYNQRTNHVPIGAYGARFNDHRTALFDERLLMEVRYEPRLTRTFQLFLRAHANYYNYDGRFIFDSLFEDHLSGAWFGGEGRLVWTPIHDLRLTAGAEAQAHVRARLRGRDSGEPYFLNEDHKYSIFSPYLVGEWGATSWLRLSAGARLNVYPSADAATAVANGDPFQGDEPPVFRAAVIVKPTKTTILKLMGGNSFRVPSLYEQYYFDGNRAQYQGKEALKAEEIFTGELELSQRFADDWSILGAGHVSRISDRIHSITVDSKTGQPAPPDSEDSAQRYVNTAEPGLVAGVDLELRREWRRGWMLSATYGYQWARYLTGPTSEAMLRANPRLINAPEHLASARGVVPVIPQIASLGARVTLEAPRRIAPDTSKTTQSAIAVDVTLSGNIRRFGVGYVLGIYNLADQRYDYPVTQSYLGRVSRQNGRTFMIDLNVQYP